MAGYPLPLFGRRIVLRRRQRQGYTVGDGIGRDAVAGVETDVANALFASLERHFEARPFLLGDYPTLADIGFSGPFFRFRGISQSSGPHTASDTSAHGTANTRVGDAFVE